MEKKEIPAEGVKILNKYKVVPVEINEPDIEHISLIGVYEEYVSILNDYAKNIKTKSTVFILHDQWYQYWWKFAKLEKSILCDSNLSDYDKNYVIAFGSVINSYLKSIKDIIELYRGNASDLQKIHMNLSSAITVLDRVLFVNNYDKTYSVKDEYEKDPKKGLELTLKEVFRSSPFTSTWEFMSKEERGSSI